MFRKKGQQFKYVVKESIHTTSTLRVIPSGFLNRYSKLTSGKPSIHSEGVDKIYPKHANSLRKAGLAPPNFPKIGDLWYKQDEREDIDIEKEPDIRKNKKRNVYFCVAYSCFFTSIHRVINRLKQSSNLSWIRVKISYHRFNNLAELINGDHATKIGRGVFSKDLICR